MTKLKEILKKFDASKSNVGKVLRELEKNGDINSEGEISVGEAIMIVSDYKVGAYLIDQTKSINHLNVDLTKNGNKNVATLVITENGKLYLSR